MCGLGLGLHLPRVSFFSNFQLPFCIQVAILWKKKSFFEINAKVQFNKLHFSIFMPVDQKMSDSSNSVTFHSYSLLLY